MAWEGHSVFVEKSWSGSCVSKVPVMKNARILKKVEDREWSFNLDGYNLKGL